MALELGGHLILLVPGPVCRLHCLGVLVEGAAVGVLDVSEVVGEFLFFRLVFLGEKQMEMEFSKLSWGVLTLTSVVFGHQTPLLGPKTRPPLH